MKKLFFFVSCVCAAIVVQAQSPSFAWVKQLGGNERQVAGSVTTDAQGNVYTTGTFNYTTDFDPGPGNFNLTPVGAYDVFISKLDANGNFVWAKSIGGGGYDNGSNLSFDGAGNIFMTGRFDSTVDFDPGVGVFNMTAHGYDVYILKLDPNGNFVWAKQVGNSYSTYSGPVYADNAGNVYIGGSFNGSIDFDPGPGVYNQTNAAGSAFILKLDPVGNFAWVCNMAGTSGAISSITGDATGKLYVSGVFNGNAQFTSQTLVTSMSAVNSKDVFLLKMDSLGHFIWITGLGGTGDEGAGPVRLDKWGNIYISGDTRASVLKTSYGQSFDIGNKGNTDDFVAKVNAMGTFVWVKSIGGKNYEQGTSIALDELGNLYVAGDFSDTVDFDPGPQTHVVSALGTDVYLLKLDSSGKFNWIATTTGYGYTATSSMFMDAVGNIYISGTFVGGADFDPGTGVDSLYAAPGASFSDYDAFILKLQQPTLAVNQQVMSAGSVSIYPNPGEGIFTVSFGQPVNNASLEVYSMVGQMVYKQDNLEATTKIDISSAANGMYLLQLVSDGKKIGMQKLVKQ